MTIESRFFRPLSNLLPLRGATLALALCIVFSACGRRGDPIPPGAKISDAPFDLKISGRNGQLVLSWKTPKSQEGALGFKVLRSAWPPKKVSCEDCPESMEEGADLDIEELRSRGLAETEWIDPLALNNWTVKYRVLTIDRNKRPGTLSKPVAVRWIDIPAPDAMVRTGDGSATVEIKQPEWPEGMEAAGINIYGSNGKKLAHAGAGKNDLYLSGLENGVETRFTVHLVGQTHEGWMIEGPGTELFATPIDSLGPIPPFELSAEPRANGARLSWKLHRKNAQTAIILLRSESDGILEKLEKLPGNATEYLDKKIEQGKSYRYSLIAEDKAGNQSLPTKDVLVNFKNPGTANKE